MWGRSPQFFIFCFTARAILTASDWSRRLVSSSERIPQWIWWQQCTWKPGIGRAGMVKASLVSFTPLPLPSYGIHASAFPWWIQGLLQHSITTYLALTPFNPTNQIKVIGLESSLYYFKRSKTSACDGGGWISRNALEQADRMAYIFSVAFLSRNCSVIKKNNCRRKLVTGGIAPQDRMDVRIQSHVQY